MQGSEIVQAGSSPFDAIRHVEPDGREWWSGRELMHPLGYTKWQNMQRAVERAKASCRNMVGTDASNFTDASKISKSVTNKGFDVQMTRFGCYLVAMNGDPTKPEIAAAQSYFATMTRKAELQTIAPPAVALPPQPKPWAERIRATFLPHRKWLQDNLPGYWTIASVTEMEMLVLEDELIRHGFNPQPGDRPDVSIGLLWATERRSRGLPPPVKKALLYLPDQKGNVWVHAYPNEELPAFNAWFHDPYLRRKLLAYLAAKPAFRPAGELTTASVVDHTCKVLANGPAELAPPVRKQLDAADGFAPVGKRIPALAGPQPSLFDARRNH